MFGPGLTSALLMNQVQRRVELDDATIVEDNEPVILIAKK